uniref:NAD kinase 2, mitochondrial n=1 Tax=Steinernema glaseri TaxID=37863 RepID=A0A1I7YID4_9BILA
MHSLSVCAVKCVSAYASAVLKNGFPAACRRQLTTNSRQFVGHLNDDIALGSAMPNSTHDGCCESGTAVANGSDTDTQKMEFNPKRVLLLSKITRLEFERRRHPNLNESELELLLKTRGSDYERLLNKHNHHLSYLNLINSELNRAGIETRIVKRFNYTDDVIDWADAIFSAGGDGTFLLAASKIKTRDKAVIGINTDPTGSEGYMCLMRKKPADAFPEALQRLLSGDFRWLWRQRIRISLVNGRLDDPVELHDQELHVDIDEVRARQSSTTLSSEHRYPLLSLNEVYIGESQSSRVSYYELQLDSQPMVKQKSSGITICTGTGSTSWHFNINKLTNECVSELLNILNGTFNTAVEPTKDNVQKIVDQFNSRLVYEPDCKKMAYSVRDAIWNATFPRLPPRGFAERIRVKSRCFDANLVIDGGISYKFNDGMEAVLEMHPEDALRTVILG